MDIQENERQTTRTSLELLYNISRELASALELRALLQRVIFLSMENLGAITGSIIVLDDQGQPVDSVLIVGTKVYENITSQLRITFDQGLAGWVARNSRAVLIPDTSQDDRWLRRPDDDVERTGPKSAVSAPLQVRDRLVGVMTLVHPTPDSFKENHLELLRAIADQASIAVLNARLYNDSQRQARVMTAVAESAAIITASLDQGEVLQRILEQISHALDVEVVSLALLNHQEDVLIYRASTAIKGQGIVGFQIKTTQGVAGWVLREGKGIIVPEATNDPRFFAKIDQLLGIKTQAIACAPIWSSGNIIGVLEARNPLSGGFDPDALLVLSGIGSMAGTAITHAQLFEQLQTAHQRYRELFEDNIDPILITDWNGIILEANRQVEISAGFSEQELLHMSINQLLTHGEEISPENQQILASGQTISYESILRAHHGREVPVQIYGRMVDIDGTSNLQWILRDITERKNLDNLRDDLISMIYHDLRSPLANVVSSLDVLTSFTPNQEDPAFKSLLDIAMRSTERIQRLTNSLLDMNRLEAGQSIGNRQPIFPTTMVKDAVDLVIPISQNKNQQLLTSLPHDLPKVLVDPEMIKRVLSNLLENAVKYTPPGSKISIGASRKGKWVQMWVQDSGSGIPPSEKERIFDKYTRLHAQEGPRGIGLGLAYCRLALEGHGGRIWVEDAPIKGARFVFTLPVAKDK
jgi:NtrC-family two-component system sensor histidine kinase KinB